MPFDKLKKIFNKQDSSRNPDAFDLEEKLNEVDINIEHILDTYNLDKRNKIKFENYIKEQIKNNKKLKVYLTTQYECVKNFIHTLKSELSLEEGIKKVKNTSHLVEKYREKIDDLKKSRSLYVNQYNKAIENINRETGNTYNGPRLTTEGLSFH